MDLKQTIEMQNTYHLIAFVAVGKAVRDLQPKSKKALDEIFKLID